MKIAESGILLTDWLLAAVTAWLAWELFREALRLKDRAIGLWVGAFCAVAGSSTLGGISQSFSASMEPGAAILVRTGTLVLADAAILLFLLSTLRAFTSGRALAIGAGLAVAKFALFVVCAAVKDDVRMVIYDGALTMLVVITLGTWGAWAQRMPSATWILAGVLVSMLGALFQQGRVSIHPQLSYDDLYHVVQTAAMYLLYRGGLLLRERGPAPDFEATQPLPIAKEEMRTHELRCLGPHGFHRVTYYEWGDAENPRVVLCVHGLTRNGRDFDVLARALAPQFRVVCPDVRRAGPEPMADAQTGLWLPGLSRRHGGDRRADRRRQSGLDRHVDGWPDRHDARGAARDPNSAAAAERHRAFYSTCGPRTIGPVCG